MLRCNLIYKGQQIDPHWIALAAVEEAKNYARKAKYQSDSFFFNIFHTYPSYYLFTDAAWASADQVGGCGFYILNSNKGIVVAGCSRIHAESLLEAEPVAIEVGLKIAAEWILKIEVVFTDCLEARKVLERNTSHNVWRTNNKIAKLRRGLNRSNTNVEVIPREWNELADELAAHGRRTPEISLFHQGLDLPFWLMRSIKRAGYHLN